MKFWTMLVAAANGMDQPDPAGPAAAETSVIMINMNTANIQVA